MYFICDIKCGLLIHKKPLFSEFFFIFFLSLKLCFVFNDNKKNRKNTEKMGATTTRETSYVFVCASFLFCFVFHISDTMFTLLYLYDLCSYLLFVLFFWEGVICLCFTFFPQLFTFPFVFFIHYLSFKHVFVPSIMVE